MLKLSRIRNVDFLHFGLTFLITEKIVRIEIQVGRLALLIWLKDRTFIDSNYPKLISSIDNEGGL